MFLIDVILAALAGAWRRWDGWGEQLPGGIRGLIGAAIVGACAYWGIGSLWAIWPAAWATWALLRGFPDGSWESYQKSLKHWVLPALAAIGPGLAGAWPIWHNGIPYIATAVFVGVLYPTVSRHVFNDWGAWLKEIAAGVCIGGGMLWL